MHARYYVASSLFNIFLPHLDMLKYLGSSTTGSYVTVGYSYSTSFFISFSLFMFLLRHYDSISYVEFSSTIIIFDSSLYVDQICDKVFSNSNSSDFISSV